MKRVLSFAFLLIVLSCKEDPGPSFSITSFSPAECYPGEAVKIVGVDFNTDRSAYTIRFGAAEGFVSTVTSTEISVIVPEGGTSDFISISVNGKTTITEDQFTVLTRSASATPNSGRTGSYVTLSGGKFDENTEVLFGDKTATVISVTPTSMVVAVPSTTATTTDVHVKFNANSDVLALRGFTVKHDTWVSKGALPGIAGRANAIWFSIGSKIYFGSGRDISQGSSSIKFLFDVWEYSPETSQWTAKKDFPGIVSGPNLYPIEQQNVFVIDGKAYVLYGRIIYAYDPVKDEWTARKEFYTMNGRYAPVAFSIGNKGYVGTGENGILFNDLWEYDAVADQWTKKADFPGAARYYASGFGIGNKGYIGGGAAPGLNDRGDFYEYDQAQNVWAKKADCPASQLYGFRAYVSAGNFGFVGDQARKFYKYDPVPDKWIQLEDSPEQMGGLSLWAVSVSGRIFVHNTVNFWEMKIDE